MLALSVAHRGHVVETGRIVLEGTTRGLLEKPKVKAAYLGIRKEPTAHQAGSSDTKAPAGFRSRPFFVEAEIWLRGALWIVCENAKPSAPRFSRSAVAWTYHRSQGDPAGAGDQTGLSAQKLTLD